jgi:hypothetical protein
MPPSSCPHKYGMQREAASWHRCSVPRTCTRSSVPSQFRDQQMDMLRHDNIADHYEAIAPARLFQDGEEAVASSGRIQKRQSSVAGTGDKVQVVRPIVRCKPLGITAYGIGSIVPAPSTSSGQALAKNARTGHPQSRNGKQKTVQKGWATRPDLGCEWLQYQKSLTYQCNSISVQ